MGEEVIVAAADSEVDAEVIAGRLRDGTAASTMATETVKRIGPLSDAAWGFAKKAGA